MSLYNQTVQQQFDHNIGITDNALELVRHIFVAIATVKGFMILAIAFLTYFLLEMFLSKNIEIKNRVKMSNSEAGMFLTAIMLLGVTILPLAVAYHRLIGDRFMDISGAILMLTIAVLSCFVTSAILKKHIDSSDPARKQAFLIIPAMGIIVSIIVKYLAMWIQAFIIGIINLVIRVTHIPFVFHYFLIATLLNLGISFLLTNFMGASQMSGEVNIIGSMIGGIAHGIASNKKIKELKEAYTDKMKKGEVP